MIGVAPLLKDFSALSLSYKMGMHKQKKLYTEHVKYVY